MTTSTDFYRCHWCVSLNDALKKDWCLCATSQRTLVCSSCGRCFCAAPKKWTSAFWELASADLISRRWQNKKATPSPASTGDLQRPVILVVDDDKLIHTIVDRILEGFEGTILHARDGAEALRTARAVKPEILLTDALLPVLDGRDVARLLKSDPTTAATRTIVMTALYKGSRYRSEAYRQFRVDAYIEKPVSAEKLRGVIDEMLAGVFEHRQAIAS